MKKNVNAFTMIINKNKFPMIPGKYLASTPRVSKIFFGNWQIGASQI
jgi:hypothetical protein